MSFHEAADFYARPRNCRIHPCHPSLRCARLRESKSRARGIMATFPPARRPGRFSVSGPPRPSRGDDSWRQDLSLGHVRDSRIMTARRGIELHRPTILSGPTRRSVIEPNRIRHLGVVDEQCGFRLIHQDSHMPLKEHDDECVGPAGGGKPIAQPIMTIDSAKFSASKTCQRRENRPGSWPADNRRRT